MRLASCVVGLLVVARFGVAEAQSNPATPEHVVRDFFKAENEGRWLDAARLLDLKRFEAFRQMTLKTLRTFRPSRRTPEEMMKWEPEMPRAVAEYQAQRANKDFEMFDFLGNDFARVSSADSLEALPVEQAAARWLEAKGPKWQEERDRKRSAMRPPIKCPESLDSVTASALAYTGPTAVILGATAGGDSTRYVVVGVSFGPRLDARQDRIERSPHVLTLVRVNGAWRIIPTHDMITSTGFVGNVSFSVACEMEKPAKESSKKK